MNDNISLQTIRDYLKGKLTGPDQARVQEYLSTHMEDPEVQKLLDGWFDECRQEGDAAGRDALRFTRERMGLSRKPVRLTGWLMAAAVALLLALPFAFRAGFNARPETAPIAWNEVTVPIAETREVSLPDGTVLTLNAGSRVTWPEAFTGTKREIFLDGEVIASVVKDSEHPFIIHSGEADICVHGTTFDLKSYRSATMLEVVLMEGSVSLFLPADEGRREVRLTPGDIAQFDRQIGSVSLGKISPDGFKTFNDNHSFSFINIPLKDIAADLERSFGTPIVVADAKVASQRFLAFFTNGEDLDEILKLLTRNGNLKVVRSDGIVYLYGKK